MSIQIETSKSQGSSLIAVTGEVDLYTSPELRSAILEAFNAGATVVAVDLSGVGYMDSSGVATLVEGLRSANDKDRTFRLVAPSQAVMKVLNLAKLDQVFEVSPTP